MLEAKRLLYHSDPVGEKFVGWAVMITHYFSRLFTKLNITA